MLYSIGNLAGLAAAGLASQLIPLIGWPAFYLCATAVFITVIAISHQALLEARPSPERETLQL